MKANLLIALIVAPLLLSGCVVAPDPGYPAAGYAPAYGYAPGYYYPPVVGSVDVGVGFGGGDRWGGRGDRH